MTTSSPSTSSSCARPLTDTQLVMLSQAAQRADGKVVPPPHLKGSVIQRVMASLAGKGLIQPAATNVGSDAVQPDGSHAGACPVISSAGLAAIGISIDAETVVAVEPSGIMPDMDPDAVDGAEFLLARRDQASGDPGLPAGDTSGASIFTSHPRAGTKQAQVLALLAYPEGVSIDALMAATGWRSHTTRAVLSGLRKRGHAIERFPGSERGGSRYRLTAPSCAPAASDPAA